MKQILLVFRNVIELLCQKLATDMTLPTSSHKVTWSTWYKIKIIVKQISNVFWDVVQLLYQKLATDVTFPASSHKVTWSIWYKIKTIMKKVLSVFSNVVELLYQKLATNDVLLAKRKYFFSIFIISYVVMCVVLRQKYFFNIPRLIFEFLNYKT